MKRLRLSTVLLLVVILALLVDRWRLARREEHMQAIYKREVMDMGVAFATYKARVAAGTGAPVTANSPAGGSPPVQTAPGR
jgi:hypothetical protein